MSYQFKGNSRLKNSFFSRMHHIIILISLLFSLVVYAQDQKIKIASIDVIGTKTATPEVVISSSGLHVGMEANQEDFSEAVKQLWSLGLFSDVKILNELESPEGAFLIIAVEEYPRLNKLFLEGNKKIKTDELSEVLNLHPGQALTPFIVYESQRKLQKLYYDDGYLLAEIEPTTFEGEKENSRGIKFQITEHEKVSVGDINFTGNTQLSDEKLKKKMEKIKEERWWKFWADTDFSIDNLRSDERAIEAYLHSLGYRDAEILGDSLYYSEDLKKLFFRIDLYEGEKYKYGHVTVTGNTVFESDDILSTLGIAEGDEYNSEKLMEAIELGVRSPYMDKGYLYCQINPIEMPVAADTIDLTMEITEMSPVKVRYINIEGNDVTKENVIRRELKIFPGDIFSRTALMRSQRELMVLNYFANVTPDVIPYTDDQVDLLIDLEEKNTGMANASAGYSEEEGFIGSIGLQFPNFMGNGQQLGLNLQRASSYQSVSLNFTEPWLFGTPNALGASIFDKNRTQGSTDNIFSSTTTTSTYYDLHSRGGSLTFGRRFNWPDNYFRGSWRLQTALNKYDTTKVYDWEVFDLINPAHLEKSWGISLTQSIYRDSRNAPEFPTTGSLLSLTSTYSGGLLGGNENYFKQNASLEWFNPIWTDKLTMRNYFETGFLTSLSSDSSSIIPYDNHFFMGGAGLIQGSTLRGYPERSVGTLDGSSYWGGKSSFKYSMELRYLLSPNPMMYLIGFAEAGNVWDNFNSSNLFDLKRSAGIGGRIIMPPLGMLGIDIGWGFDRESIGLEPTTWKTPEFHFIFGQQF